jgi:two-component sensor histidine kinase/tetratricopeptide (TPR) repeat protein
MIIFSLKSSVLIYIFLASTYAYAQDKTFSEKLARLSPTEQVYLYDEYAQKYKESQPKKSLEYAQKGVELAQKVKDTGSVAYFFTFIGVLYKNMGEYEQALDFYQKAIPINEKLKNWQGNAGIYNNIAFVYRLQGKYKDALSYYLKSLALFEEPKYAKQKSNVINNIGSLYADQKQFRRALEYFEQALQIAANIKDTLGIAFAYNNIGEVYQKQGKWQEAKVNFMQSLVWKKRKKHWRSIASGYANLGLVYEDEKIYDSADFYLLEALDIYRKIDDANGEVETLLRLGELAVLLKDETKASLNYQTALEKSLKIGAKPLTEKAYKYLSEYFAQKQDFGKAYRLRVLYDTTKDSLMSVEQMKQINELQARYNDQAKSKQIEILQKEKQISQLEKEAEKRQKWILIAGLAILVLVALGLWWAYRLKQRRNEVLSLKNEEIAEALLQKEMLLKEIHHRVKNNLQIISSLLHLQAHKSQNPQQLLQQSQDRIQAMAIIHEKLYQSNNLQSISLQEYVENLISYFEKTYSLQEKQIRFQTHLDDIFLDIDKLIPCGLILNELITNSIKYAFQENQEGIIKIWASLQGNMCHLEISDNGIGLPEGFQTQKLKSLGLRLVDGLVRQIKGVWQTQNQAGAKFLIQFEPNLKVA